jgi:hypothetical protein
MALGQIGMFLPSESQYLKPGSYDDALRAQAVKIANYLSSMDQFYANLDESKRQYDLTLSWQKESFGQELAFKEKQLATTSALQERQLTSQEKYNESILKLKQQELGLESQKLYSTNQSNKASQSSTAELLNFMKNQSAQQGQDALTMLGMTLSAQKGRSVPGGSGSGLVDLGDVQARVVPGYNYYNTTGQVSGFDYSGA